jgi:(2Fe-2S) ferredoxin
LAESHLDPAIGAELEDRAKAIGARVCLARRPGHHADSSRARSRRVWIAHTAPAHTWLLGGWITEPAILDQLSWSGLGAGDVDAVAGSVPGLAAETEPVLLICTNGRRDLCCALRGRPLAEALRDRFLGRVWETTHLSGHRFAPTAVILPHGVTYGRLDPEAAAAVVDAARASTFVPDNYRGRSSFPRPAQVAEAVVRENAVAASLTELDVVLLDRRAGSWHAIVAHSDGRTWQVEVDEEQLPARRPESCGSPPLPITTYAARIVRSP